MNDRQGRIDRILEAAEWPLGADTSGRDLIHYACCQIDWIDPPYRRLCGTASARTAATPAEIARLPRCVVCVDLAHNWRCPEGLSCDLNGADAREPA